VTGVFYLPWGFDPGEILVVCAFLTNYFCGFDVWQRVMTDDVLPSFLVGTVPNVLPSPHAHAWFATVEHHADSPAWRWCGSITASVCACGGVEGGMRCMCVRACVRVCAWQCVWQCIGHDIPLRHGIPCDMGQMILQCVGSALHPACSAPSSQTQIGHAALMGGATAFVVTSLHTVTPRLASQLASMNPRAPVLLASCFLLQVYRVFSFVPKKNDKHANERTKSVSSAPPSHMRTCNALDGVFLIQRWLHCMLHVAFLR